ncbi:hypothetical protein JCM8097_008423 [Rhodosporidiobolus ruineniae]
MSDREDSPPLQLDPRTLAALMEFRQEQEEVQDRLRAMEEKQNGDDGEEKKMISLQEYKATFTEDFQVSQFWYSDAFANHFSRFVYSFCTPTTRIAFLSCPTSFVAFQHQNPVKDAWLFEYDTRFRLFGGDRFVHYDLEEPEKFPEELRGTVDIAIADPPFLNEVTNRYFAQTLRSLLKPNGKFLLLTSTSVSARSAVYDSPPVGPLHETSFEVTHDGGRLQNDFRCWTSWSWEGEREGVRTLSEEEAIARAR